MASVYIEPRPKGRHERDPIDDYVVEDHADHVLAKLKTQHEAHAYSLTLTIYEVLAQLLPDERKVIATIVRCDGIRPEQLTVQRPCLAWA